MVIIKLFQKIKHEAISTVKNLNYTEPNIIIFIIYGLLYDIVINLYKPFSVKFLDRIGGTEFHISLLNSLPGFAAIFALLPGSLLISRFQSKRKITSVFFAFSRAFILMLAFVPLFPDVSQPMLFVILVSAMNFFDAISQCSLQSFLGETFNGFTRAKAISLRNKIGNVFVLIVTLTTGLIITFIPKSDEQRMLIYQLFFALSFIFGIIEISVFRKFKDKKTYNTTVSSNETQQVIEKPNLNTIFETLKDKKFRNFLLSTIIFYFTWQAGWPLSSILQVKTLGSSEFWISVFSVSSGITSFFVASKWTKFLSKKGNDFTLFIGSFGLAINMFIFAITPNLYIMTISSMFSGAVTIGVNIALLNGLLGATPGKSLVVYIAVYNTFVNISLAISPYVSLLLLDSFSIRTSLVIVGIMRLISSLVLFIRFYIGRKTPIEKHG